MIEQSHYASVRLQNILAAPVADFARQRNYGYVSSQQSTTDTHQNIFRNRKDA